MEEEKRVTKRNKKSNVMHSVRTKIVGAMILAMVILSVCLSVVLIRNLRIPLMNINQSYLYDLALAHKMGHDALSHSAAANIAVADKKYRNHVNFSS